MTAPVGGIGGPPPPGYQPRPAAPPRPPGGPGSGSFAEQLQGSGSLRFSKHAMQRLQSRGINSEPAAMRRLERGVQLAAGKGGRDAVVMVDDTAYVVSVGNRTVITAVDAAHMRDQVFTNIDSAVIA
jgi:flagellar operon protein